MDKVIGNPDGWYAAWMKIVTWVGEHNFTPLHPNMIIFLLACLATLGGCWWAWITFIRPPQATGGGH